MLKFLIILILVGYVLFRVVGFIFKTLFITASQFQQKQNVNGSRQSHRRKAPDSNLNIDYVPGGRGEKSGKSGENGDYIDFEEVDK